MFGDVVRRYRQQTGLTQEDLAARTGLSARSIGKIEAGRTGSPRAATLRLLADAFALIDADRERFYSAAATPQAGPSMTLDDPPAALVVPAQLPPDVPAFTGRADELRQLDAVLDGTAVQPTAVAISAVCGTAGVGKTALAVHWAHRVRHRFPDGQLYVNLRGYDPEQPTSAADALTRFLRALAVPGTDIPVDVEERAAYYRTRMSERRILVLLDNAATVEQVRPLLPGTPLCAVVITSRDSLAALVAAHGAQRVSLRLLPSGEAMALLRRLVGPRIEAEPDAALTLMRLCAQLPLALRVAAELAVSRATSPLSELVDELADQQQRLDLLDAGGDPRAAVTAVFSWSLQHLPPDATRTFRLLGLHPGPDFDGHVTAALTASSLTQSRRTLDLLARAHLVTMVRTDRFEMHDLLHVYAIQLAMDEDSDTDRRDAVNRLFGHYLGTAATAMDHLYPAGGRYRPYITPSSTPVPDLSHPDAARGWLDRERTNLVAVAAHAATHGWPAHAIELSGILAEYLDGGRYSEALAIHGFAYDAARQSGDLSAQAYALRGIGTAHQGMARYDPATAYYQQALALFRAAGDRTGEARTLSAIGNVERRRGDYVRAADCFKRATGLFRQLGDLTAEAYLVCNLGVVMRQLGRYAEAVESHERALILHRQAADLAGEAGTLNRLGLTEQRLGHYAQAVDHHEQALAGFRRLGRTHSEAHALDNLGAAHLHLGQPRRAAEHIEQAIRIFREISDRDGEATALNGLGEVARASGRPAEALVHHTHSLAIATDIGGREQQARAHAGLGDVYRDRHERARARFHYQQALALYQALSSPLADEIRVRLAVEEETGVVDTTTDRPVTSRPN
ncbi:tetratricopeptide repeat protein [Micromonospora cathayae]|uniref:Tetratricopeptide repeat protein n=1 Tax=Micromonospora cathayae TaxID=3028804 RepID=A0ABY7ZW31_9ACTN|nr:tetratricopeptide repeat protein [Micromonospora sp. HUAS 3]WDZ86322.1 tetratricopeptide repeat protein [Micromonospora sp. HUAS 3]